MIPSEQLASLHALVVDETYNQYLRDQMICDLVMADGKRAQGDYTSVENIVINQDQAKVYAKHRALSKIWREYGFDIRTMPAAS